MLIAELLRRARERLLITTGAVAARREAERVGRLVAEIADPPVPELDQVRSRELAAVDVVDHDAGDRRMRGIDEDARQPRGLQPLDLVVGWDERDHQEPVGAVAAVEELERVLAPLLRFDVEQHEVVRRAGERGGDAPYAL